MSTKVVSKAKQKYKYYAKQKNSKRFNLEVGLRGFLCSCNNREKECVREAYNLLNKYADVLYPVVATTENEENPKELEEELSRELSHLKSKNEIRRFQVIDSGAKNLLFIRTTLEDPVALAEKIISDISEVNGQQTRFLIRLVPVNITCKAYVNDILNAFQPLIERCFKDSAKTFSIVFNHRNNDTIDKELLIKCLADKVSSTRDDHKVNLKDAELSLIVEIIRGYAFLSIAPHYCKYKKYNLLQICGTETLDKDSYEATT